MWIRLAFRFEQLPTGAIAETAKTLAYKAV